jgi:hypothetical protein
MSLIAEKGVSRTTLKRRFAIPAFAVRFICYIG